MDFNKIIRSERVLLKPMELADFIQMQELTMDKKMWYHFTADLSDTIILENWISSAVMDLQEKKALPFTIFHPLNNEIIGTTRIGNISKRDSRVEIGWTWITKKYQGTGINRHVKQLLFKFLFTETDILRIEFKTDILNTPARKSMEKVGLVAEGILRSDTLMTNNRRRDTIYYSILKDEWEKE